MSWQIFKWRQCSTGSLQEAKVKVKVKIVEGVFISNQWDVRDQGWGVCLEIKEVSCIKIIEWKRSLHVSQITGVEPTVSRWNIKEELESLRKAKEPVLTVWTYLNKLDQFKLGLRLIQSKLDKGIWVFVEFSQWLVDQSNPDFGLSQSRKCNVCGTDLEGEWLARSSGKLKCLYLSKVLMANEHSEICKSGKGSGCDWKRVFSLKGILQGKREQCLLWVVKEGLRKGFYSRFWGMIECEREGEACKLAIFYFSEVYMILWFYPQFWGFSCKSCILVVLVLLLFNFDFYCYIPKDSWTVRLVELPTLAP